MALLGDGKLDAGLAKLLGRNRHSVESRLQEASDVKTHEGPEALLSRDEYGVVGWEGCSRAASFY